MAKFSLDDKFGTNWQFPRLGNDVHGLAGTGELGGQAVRQMRVLEPGAGGGAPSASFDAPPWQRSLKTKDRLEPDVSYNAAANGGEFVVLSCPPLPPDPFHVVGVAEAHCNPADPHFNPVGWPRAGAFRKCLWIMPKPAPIRRKRCAQTAPTWSGSSCARMSQHLGGRTRAPWLYRCP